MLETATFGLPGFLFLVRFFGASFALPMNFLIQRPKNPPINTGNSFAR